MGGRVGKWTRFQKCNLSQFRTFGKDFLKKNTESRNSQAVITANIGPLVYDHRLELRVNRVGTYEITKCYVALNVNSTPETRMDRHI